MTATEHISRPFLTLINRDIRTSRAKKVRHVVVAKVSLLTESKSLRNKFQGDLINCELYIVANLIRLSVSARNRVSQTLTEIPNYISLSARLKTFVVPALIMTTKS